MYGAWNQSLNVYPLANQFSMSHPKNIMFHWNIKGIVGVYNVACTQFGLAQYYRYYMIMITCHINVGKYWVFLVEWHFFAPNSFHENSSTWIVTLRKSISQTLLAR